MGIYEYSDSKTWQLKRKQKHLIQTFIYRFN